jgi:MerR family copper efflux transcriptional regulator
MSLHLYTGDTVLDSIPYCRVYDNEGRSMVSRRLKIGQVAALGGVNLQTVCYYEREKLLPEPPRLSSGYRVFSEDTVRRVRFIKRAQQLGFTLAEIRELLMLRVDPGGDSAAVRLLAKRKIGEIEEKIHALEAMKTALEHLTDKCPGKGPASECPILESIDSGVALP